MRISRRHFLELSALGGVTAPLGAKPHTTFVFLGTYTNQGSKGIYAWRFTESSGKLEPIGLVAETPNPTFLAVHPNGRYLYAANEVSNFNADKHGSLSAFSIDLKTGKLTEINKVSSMGNGPCHLSIDRTAKCVLAANYGGGTVAAMKIRPDFGLEESKSFHQHQGSGPNKRRQERPHAHSINPSPGNNFAVAADLGTDQLLVYALDAAQAKLTPHTTPFTRTAPGAGPRHFAFHPSTRFAYAINELANTITLYKWDEIRGTLKEVESVPTLPKDFKGDNSTAEIVVHPTGGWVYGSNRGHDSIAVFQVDKKTGQLTPAGHTPTQGVMPRNFALDPGGKWLFAANQRGNNVVLFPLKDGRPQAAKAHFELNQPVCVRFAGAA